MFHDCDSPDFERVSNGVHICKNCGEQVTEVDLLALLYGPIVTSDSLQKANADVAYQA